jgi:Leucine-rich repeat (LRR) protein
LTDTVDLDREESVTLVSSPDLIGNLEILLNIDPFMTDIYIYPITLNFHEGDVEWLQGLDVFNFISRVKTVVFDGLEPMAIQAEKSEVSADAPDGETEWDMAMYDPDYWTWRHPESLMEVLDLEEVTAVKSLDLRPKDAVLVIKRSWSLSEGGVKWTTTKTSPLKSVGRFYTPAQDILLHPKLKNIQTLKLKELPDVSVLFSGEVLQNLKSLNDLDLSQAQFVNDNQVRALASVANLKSLSLPWSKINDVSALTQLKEVTYINLRFTELVEVSQLAEVMNLKGLDLSGIPDTDDVYVSSLVQLKELESLNLSKLLKVTNISALQKLENLRTLNLSSTGFSQFTMLEEFKNLESLDLSKLRVKTSELKNLKKLKSLSLVNTKVDDGCFSDLAHLTSLESLNLIYTDVRHISGLAALKNLKSLFVIKRLINKHDIQALTEALPMLQIHFK